MTQPVSPLHRADCAATTGHRPAWLALLLGPALAIGIYSPTLFGSFLSDDYLVNTMLTHDADPQVYWSAVLADFSREWMGLKGGGMYRPFVSMSFALNYLVDGCSSFWFHLINVLVHALTAWCGAMVCARCSPQRPTMAAMLGGALIAAHPAFAESACWVSARNSGIQVLFATISMLGFVNYLHDRRARSLALCIAGFLSALLTKESAVLLPFSFVALDVLLRGWRGLHRRAVHLGMFAVLAAYFGMRKLLLGVFLGGDSEGLQSIHSDDILTNLLAKTELLVTPVGSSYPAGLGAALGYLCGASLALLVAPAVTRRATAWIPLVVFAWVGLHFAPSYKLVVDTQSLSGSRLVIGATAVFAIGLSLIASRTQWPRVTRWAAAGLVAALATLSIGRMTAFLRAYEDMHTLRADLDEAAKDATPAQPIGLIAVNRALEGVTFLNCNAIFPLLEKPFAETDKPLVSLGFVFQPVPASEHLLFDVGPWRALREMGATMFEWHRDPAAPAGVAQIDRRLQTAPEPLPALEPNARDGDTVFLSNGVLDVWGIEALEVEVRGVCTGGRVEWLYAGADGQPQEYVKFPVPPSFQDAVDHAALGTPTPRGDNTVFYVDLSHALTFLAVGKLGGLAGFKVHTDGADAKAVKVRLLPRLGPLPTQRLAGAELSLANTRSRLFAPKLPAGATSMTLYLMGPDTTLTLPVQPGAVEFSGELQAKISVILRSSRQKRYYLYYEAVGSRRWRSAVDWVVLRR